MRSVEGFPFTRLHFFCPQSMHLLYLDDAGSANNANERYLVLGGIAVYEAQIDWLTRELDIIAAQINPSDPDLVEFHASVCFSGNTDPWKALKKEERKDVIRQVLGVIPRAYETCNAFACAIRKAAYPGTDPMELAFEDLCKRFDIYSEHCRYTHVCRFESFTHCAASRSCCVRDV